MKFKISWPAGIILAIAAFVIFILSFVYKAVFVPKYSHKLVSEDYYKDGMNYQKETIDKLNNAVELKQNITYKKVTEGLLFKFPSEFEASQITGTISFQRLSNKKIDFQYPLELETLEYLILDNKLVEGRWNVRIDWSVNNKSYLFKEKIMY
ncbi:FixH family protein [Lutibacter sp.]